jgi:hypothetical protein|tara:strand:+ start:254 stop:451 length:198 start_codon:yes stop_codon:yes gene_type:complete
MSIFGLAKKGFGLLGKAKKKVSNVSDKTAGNVGMGGTVVAVVGGAEAIKRKNKKARATKKNKEKK